MSVNRSNFSLPSRARGLSLVELMVAVTLGLVLCLGAVNLFMQSKVSYLQDEESARLQENGRFALRYLSHELGMSGFFGRQVSTEEPPDPPSGGDDCFNFLLGQDALGNPRPSFPFEHYDDVKESERAGLPIPAACWEAGDTLFEDASQPSSDLVVIRRTKDENTDPDLPGVSLNEDAIYLLVEDYNPANDFQQGGVHGPDRVWWEYVPQILFVRPYSVAVGDGIPTLCRKVLSESALSVGPTECLVEGVENMQLEFGVDSDGDQQADYFVDNPTDAELAGAVATRIYLLVRSVGEIGGYTNDKAFTLGQTAIAAADDGFYRRVMQTTVLLRNSEAFKF